MTTLTTYRPNLLGRGVFDDIFDSMLDFPQLMQRTTQGYPVADIYKNDDGSTSQRERKDCKRRRGKIGPSV